jgi:transcription elongation factor Elf1
MLKPDQVQNKSMEGGPSPAPRHAYCPRCGDDRAVTSAPTASPRITVRCPVCGVFDWDTEQGEVVPRPPGGSAPHA